MEIETFGNNHVGITALTGSKVVCGGEQLAGMSRLPCAARMVARQYSPLIVSNPAPPVRLERNAS